MKIFLKTLGGFYEKQKIIKSIVYVICFRNNTSNKPSICRKSRGGVPLSENLADKQDSASNVISEANNTNVISDESEVTKEKEKVELVNDDNSEKESEKLELSSDTEKEAVKSEENSYPELILPEAKFDEDMSIDDPATYDYAGYVVKHYNPTNEKFMKERNGSMFLVDDILKDNTDKKNEKIVFQSTTVEKGKDLSEKLDEYILELEKNKDNNKIDADDIRNKVFGENPGFITSRYID